MTTQASSTGKYLNSGNGPDMQMLDINHPDYLALIHADTAFWALTQKQDIGSTITSKKFLNHFKKYEKEMAKEIDMLRFGLKPSAIYFNPTDQCNLNCPYCYIPEKVRKNGKNMSLKKLTESLTILKKYFKKTLPKGQKPQIVFHGSEPLMNKDNLFKAIETFSSDFLFGIQTNGTLLTKEDVNFIKKHKVVIGISIDGHSAAISDRTRKNWEGKGTFNKVIDSLNMLKGYDRFSVICTVTKENVTNLPKIVDFLHKHKVENCLLNQVRCTLKGGQNLKPTDAQMAKMFIKALDRSHTLYQKTGHKLVVVNFANIVLSILAPSARKLMCDISPCGGGRCFFAVSAKGDAFPCSEFIGLKKFKGGNIFKDKIENILISPPFNLVTERKIESISPCNKCAIRHFCGSPCPAESHEINGKMNTPGAFCEFYEEQVRFAFRIIADGIEQNFLANNWDKDTSQMFQF